MTSVSQWPRLVALALTGLEAVALVGYSVAIAVAARSSRGSSVRATGVEIAIYVAFAVLLGLLARGLARRSPMARTPFLVAQLFVLVVGYTVFAGDGTATTVVGAVILVVGAVGTVVGFLPGLPATLTGRDPDAG